MRRAPRELPLARLEVGAQLAAQEQQRGHQPKEDRRYYNDCEPESQSADVHGGLIETRDIERRQALNDRQGHDRGDDPDDSSDDRQHQAFGQKLRDELPRRRAHRDANRHFFLARQRPRQQEGSHVQTADHKEESDRAEEHHQCRAVVTKLLVEQRHQS